MPDPNVHENVHETFEKMCDDAISTLKARIKAKETGFLKWNDFGTIVTKRKKLLNDFAVFISLCHGPKQISKL